ncbi:hypothetical protein B0F90DRAFT_1731839 [Multifurca ochricompacta]|uniref:Uncharacterized protein n=1 Tax=Multifurca ochricompacta TaxID=376703 RepID=A0AAD4M1T7_9AGAM|nr:hypothetical protein B0F90DRAFT_1731839 [Multifurca ochricompacta]
MAARATRYSAQVFRAQKSAMPLPPAHRGQMVSSLIWSLSTPSACLPYLKPTPLPVPALSQVVKRGMATLSKSKHLKLQESEDDALARFHRAVRDESSSTIDMWSLPLEPLDVHIPSFPARVENATFRDHVSLLRDNFLNSLKNISSMRKLAQENAFPGRETPSSRSFQIFQAKSTKDSAWVAPLRNILLENYKRVNNAIAEGDQKTIALLTVDEYAKSALKKLRVLHPVGSSTMYRWRLVSQPSPLRIVSIRAIEGYLGLRPPRTGNPLYVNVVARFETIQTLTKRGVASTTEPKRVVEHVLFEKRMWYDTPWTIKEQLHVGR